MADARVRRTLAAGISVVLAAVGWVAVGAPLARRWGEREARIDAVRRQRDGLAALATHRAALARAAAEGEAAAAALPARLLRGRTPALAAAALQALLQEAAIASRVSVTQLDVATPADSLGPPSALPATLAAVTDIYGLADFLRRLERGATRLEVTELVVSPNPGLQGELLQVALTVRAPYLVAP